MAHSSFSSWRRRFSAHFHAQLFPEFLHVFADFEHFIVRLTPILDLGSIRADLFPVWRAILVLNFGWLPFLIATQLPLPSALLWQAILKILLPFHFGN